jgi:hypothetical protein
MTAAQTPRSEDAELQEIIWAIYLDGRGDQLKEPIPAESTFPQFEARLKAWRDSTRPVFTNVRKNPIPPKGCICASFWTVRQVHKPGCPCAPAPSSGEGETEEQLVAFFSEQNIMVGAAECEVINRIAAYVAQQVEAATHKEGYDPNMLGSWVFIGDEAKLENLTALYWSYVMEDIAAHSANYDHYKLEYVQANMPYAGFDEVGIRKMLATADRQARQKIAALTDAAMAQIRMDYYYYLPPHAKAQFDKDYPLAAQQRKGDQ